MKKIKSIFFAVIFFSCFLYSYSFADAANITSPNIYATVLEDTSLINMAPTGYGISVTDTLLTGYAWSENYGWINFDPTGYGVANDGEGNLSGYAWGENTGWINFDPTGYGVTIDSDGFFHGYAWGEKIGWIVFNCVEDGSCGTNKVQTDWTAPVVPDEEDEGGGGGSGGGSSNYACENGIDDDGDTYIDFGSDPDCTSATDDDESSYIFCNLFPLLCVDDDTPPIDNPPVTEPPVDSNPPVDGGGETPIDNNPPIDNTSPGTQPENVGGGNTIPPVILGTIETTKVVFGDPVLNSISGTIAAISLGLAAMGTILSSLFVSPLTLSELVFLPLRLWSLLLTALGLKKKNRPWGVVYDSITKQPLDPAYVVLKDMMGNDVSTTITDLDGRYGFLVAKGTYTIVPGKTNYIFPSQKLSGKEKDELYNGLYFGEQITIENDEDVVSKNIPMDPVNFDWNEYAKKERKLTTFYSKFDKIVAVVSDVLFTFGFMLATVAIIASPRPYNIVIFSMYIFFIILKETALRPRPEGKLIYNGAPLAYSIIRVFQESTGTEVTHKISTKAGKYYCLVANGRYFVTIEKKLEDGTYQKIYTSHPFDVKNGYIHENFNIGF